MYQNDKYAKFAVRLRELRKSMKMNQTDFAIFIGCTQTTISQYENNAKSPSMDIVVDIVNKCKVSFDWIMGTDNANISKDITYSDVISFIEDIRKYDFLGVYIGKIELNDFNKLVGYITFTNPSLNEFMMEWKKMLDLCHASIIDNDIYTTWLNSKLDKLNIKESDCTPSIIDDTLSFFEDLHYEDQYK